MQKLVIGNLSMIARLCDACLLLLKGGQGRLRLKTCKPLMFMVYSILVAACAAFLRAGICVGMLTCRFSILGLLPFRRVNFRCIIKRCVAL